MVEDGDPLPDLRALDALQRDPEFHEDAEGGVVALVQFDLPAKAVRIDISIDEHLLGARSTGPRRRRASRARPSSPMPRG